MTLLLALASALLGPCTAGDPARDLRWQEDLDFLVQEFPRRHLDAFFHTSREEFEQHAAEIRAAIPDMTDAEVEAAFLGLVARVGDSHSQVVPATLLERFVPLGIRWFADGLFVVATTPRHSHLLGGKVLGVEGWTLEELAEKVGEYFCFGNESWMRQQLPARLLAPRFLHAIGVALSEDELLFEVETVEGAVVEETIRVGDEAAGVQVRPERVPVTAQRAGAWHHFEYLEEEGILYVQYNRCASDETHSVPELGNQLAEVLGSQPVQAFVFDVQYNGGGNSMWGTALLSGLGRFAPLKERRNVYCLIGRTTFSSATINACEIQRLYAAEFIGEPTGGAPKAYGEVKNFPLPHSGLQVDYSTKFFQLADLDTPSFEPDYPVSLTFEDYREGRDPLLDKVRELMHR